jgi:predicted DNA-binding transcriptional regulator YafY
MLSFQNTECYENLLSEEFMPRKLDDSRSYGQKLITLFARLLFSGDRYSLTELANYLECSKQTVLRLVDDIQNSYKVDIEESKEGNRKYVCIKRPGRGIACTPLTERELVVLQMCQAFAKHLLGQQQFSEAEIAIHKSKVLLATPGNSLSDHFGAMRFGTIDYSPHHDSMRTLIEAMQKHKVCKVSYQAIMEDNPKELYIKPLKLFSHRDTVYLHARLAKKPGQPYVEPEFDPLLAIHRMKKIDMTDRDFEFPTDYNFERFFNRHFGVIKEKAFTVEAIFSGWSARFVAERVWSPDQKIDPIDSEKIKLSFSASSPAEVISWLLSYGDEAEILKPEWLVKEIADKIDWMHKTYEANQPRYEA